MHRPSNYRTGYERKQITLLIWWQGLVMMMQQQLTHNNNSWLTASKVDSQQKKLTQNSNSTHNADVLTTVPYIMICVKQTMQIYFLSQKKIHHVKENIYILILPHILILKTSMHNTVSNFQILSKCWICFDRRIRDSPSFSTIFSAFTVKLTNWRLCAGWPQPSVEIKGQ